MARLGWAWWLGLLLAAVVSPASSSVTRADEDDEIVFRTPSEGMALFDAVCWIGRHLEGAITFAPPALEIARRPGGRVLVTEPVRLSSERVLGFGQDLLAPHGLLLFDVGRPDQPLWLVESRHEPTVITNRATFVAAPDASRHRHDRTPITTAVVLRNVALDRVSAPLLEAVRDALPAGAAVIPVEATNGFILRGPGRDVWAWRQLIEELDRPAGPEPRTPPDGPDARNTLEKRLAALEARVARIEGAGRPSREGGTN